MALMLAFCFASMCINSKFDCSIFTNSLVERHIEWDNSFQQFGLFWEKEVEVLRCYDRLSDSSMSQSQVHPIWLSNHSYLRRMLILKVFERKGIAGMKEISAVEAEFYNSCGRKFNTSLFVFVQKWVLPESCTPSYSPLLNCNVVSAIDFEAVQLFNNNRTFFDSVSLTFFNLFNCHVTQMPHGPECKVLKWPVFIGE